MDTIPEDIYQQIFSYLLDDNVNIIFLRSTAPKSQFNTSTYRLQFVNKTFQRSFQNYFKTNQFSLNLEDREKSLQLMRGLKKYDVSIYEMTINFYGINYIPKNDIMKAMHGINFTSLERLWIESGVQFDLEILKDCKELRYIRASNHFVRCIDETTAENMYTLLSLNKHTLETLNLPAYDFVGDIDVFPTDFRTWSSLKELEITDIHDFAAETIESSTLERLVIRHFFPRHMVIKCPNVEILFIEIDDIGADSEDDIELKIRSRQPYDEWFDNGDGFTYTCHPSELRKIGMEVEVSVYCDIGIKYYCDRYWYKY